MPEAGRDFLLPDLGEGLEDATVITWLVRVGDAVALNQPLCLVETAKAEVEVPSPYAGTVVAVGGAEGETLRVGSLLARIDPATGTGTPTALPGAVPERRPTLVGYGHDESIDRSRRSRRTPGSAASTDARPLAKPPVRLLARRLGVDLAALAPGSGASGVVTRSDVEAAARPAAPTSSLASKTTIPVRGVRLRIAEHLTTSRTRIPDASCSVVVDCHRLLAVRAGLNGRAESRGLEPAITPFSLLSYLVVQSLQASPLLNATYDDAGPSIRVHAGVHLGIGTATDRGLVVTVVRDAHAMTAHTLSTEMARLAAGARSGTLAPADLVGSTFTISNFGALGIDEGTPIINHPEAAILGVGSIRPRPHVVDVDVVARPTASLTLVFDHRVCDGAEAGHFLSDLRELIEAPELALLAP
jgi:pyruvate dehydrogenase E2 component (dihydrolipoamide acetyltransferase)